MNNALEKTNNSSPGNAGIREWIARGAVAGLVIVSIAHVALWLGLLPVRMTWPSAATIAEPQTVEGAMRVAQGEALYRDFRLEWPHSPMTYGPLEYYVPGLASRIFSMKRAGEVLLTGRIVSLVSGVILVIMLVMSCRRNGTPFALAVLSIVPLFWFPRLAENWSRFQPYQPALLLSLAGWLMLRQWIWAACHRDTFITDSVTGGKGGNICIVDNVTAQQGSDNDSVDQVTEQKVSDITRDYRNAAISVMSGIALLLLAFYFHPVVVVGAVATGVEAVVAFVRRKGSVRAVIRLVYPLVLFAMLAVGFAVTINSATNGLWKLNALDAMAVCTFDPGFAVSNLRLLLPGGLLVLTGMVVYALLNLRQPLFLAYLATLAVEVALMLKQGSSVSYLAGSTALWGVAFATSMGAAMRFDGVSGLRDWSGGSERGETGERETGVSSHGVGSPGTATDRGVHERGWLDKATIFGGRGMSVAAVLPIIAGLLQVLPRASDVHWELPGPGDRGAAEIARLVETTSPEDILFLDPFSAQEAKQPYPYADSYHAALLDANGLIRLDRLESDLRSGRWPVVLANVLYFANASSHGGPMVPAGIQDALQGKYEAVEAGKWLVWCVRRGG